MTAVLSLDTTRKCPFAPPEQHRKLRETAPISQVILPSGQTAWAVTRHEDIRTVLSDPRFSSNRRHANFPRLSPEARPQMSAKPGLINLDPPEHTQLRRSIVGEFSIKRVNALAPRIQQIVDEHIDALLVGSRPVDLVQALSLPVPSLVICELLGVPYADHEFFQSRTANFVSHKLPRETIAQSMSELFFYLNGLVTAKEQNPTDDLLGRLALRNREEGKSDHEELLVMAVLLLIAGHETTANMISLSTLALLENPEQLAIIRQDSSKTPAAIEELLRYFSIAELGLGRVATADVELGGAHIRAGDGVMILANIGNRDPSVFENGDELQVARGNRNHLSFGWGPHQCVGQSLARLELQIVLDTLFRRIPELRLAVPAEQLSFKDNSLVYGVHELPVSW